MNPNVSVQKICNGFGICGSKAYASELVQLPFNFIKSHTIKRSVGDRPLLGSNECTWGPSYWCSSEEAKVKCNVSI